MPTANTTRVTHKQAQASRSTRAALYMVFEKINPASAFDIMKALKCSKLLVLLRANITCDTQAVDACSSDRLRAP